MKQRLLLCIMLVSVILVFQQPTTSTAQSAQFADVTIDLSFPTYVRIGDNCGGELFPVHYTTEQFTVTVSGEYDFRFLQSAGVPAHAAIYRNFNPASPATDCVDSDGPIAQQTAQPRIIEELQANTLYVMVKSRCYRDIPEFQIPGTWFYDVMFGPGIVQISGNTKPPVNDPSVDAPTVDDPDSKTPENTGPEPPLFTDDRLDQPEIDKIAVYDRFDTDGNPSLHVRSVRTSDLNPVQELYLEVIIFDLVESKFFRVGLDDLPVLNAATQSPNVSAPPDEPSTTTADGVPTATERLDNHPFIDKAAIFNCVDTDGNPALMFYCVDGQGDGILMSFITQPELAAYMDHVYSEALNNQSSSYVMCDGIYQWSVLGIPYSPLPAGCPHHFSLIAGVGTQSVMRMAPSLTMAARTLYWKFSTPHNASSTSFSLICSSQWL